MPSSPSFQRGYIDRTTIMVNEPYAESAVERALSLGIFDKIGLHLNLTHGKPLTDKIKDFPEICDRKGDFKMHQIGCTRMKLDSALLQCIEEEIVAQIEKFLSWGFPLRHCDGHHHVHNRLGLYSTVLPILKKFGFSSVRNRYSIPGPFWRGLRGRLEKFKYERLIRQLGLQTTNVFVGWDGDPPSRVWRNRGTVELMVHPHYDKTGHLVNVVNFKDKIGPKMEDLCAHQ